MDWEETMNIQHKVATRMAITASTMDINHGAAVVLIHKVMQTGLSPSIVICKTPIREHDSRRGPADPGTNYIAVAMAKLAQSFATLEPSGPGSLKRPVMNGEVQWRGCVLLRGNPDIEEQKGMIIFCSFSGGTEDQDVVISENAIQAAAIALGWNV